MQFTKLCFTLLVFVLFFFFACKRKADIKLDCSTKPIVVTATITASSQCSSNGKLAIVATGSSGFSYQLNSGVFGADPTFNDLTVGTYKITVKDLDGCTKTTAFTVPENKTKGPNYIQVASIVSENCQGSSCHATGNDDAPIDILSTDCKIVFLGQSIVYKAVVDSMGSLSQSDKDKIMTWINAGGKLTD